ncbi:MAG: hypothetical protein VSS52_002305 [Thiotrichaceae bacterium]|nr:hypothetical protein [Thiotrichaceae bacterium]
MYQSNAQSHQSEIEQEDKLNTEERIWDMYYAIKYEDFNEFERLEHSKSFDTVQTASFFGFGSVFLVLAMLFL